MNALQLPVGPSGTWRRGLATAAGLFLLLGFASAATAQSSSPGANPAPIVGIEPNDCDERLEGLLNAIDATNRTFTIGTTLVRTDFRTEFEDGAGATLQFESFQLGDLLKARGCYLPDGSLQAENVELEVHGGGTPTPNATITPTPTPNPTGTPAGTQTPAPTQTPNTTQTPNPTGTPNATQTPVPTVTPGGPINCEQDVEGFLSSLDSGARTMTIAGVLVRTDNRTEFEDEFSNTISFDAFAVGFGAEAEGCFLEDGSLQAQKVEIQFRSSVTPTGTPNPTVTPTGTPDGTQTPAPTQTPNLGANNCGQDVEASVQAINATARTFTIGGVLVRTDSRTRYEDALSNNVSFEFFQVGFAAEAKGCFLSDGSLLAAKVEAQNNVSVTPTVTPTPDPSATVTPTVTPTGTPGLPNNNCDHEIESFVTVVDSANGTMIIGGVLVRTDGRTYYEDRNDTPLTFGDFGPGDKAEAEGCFQSDGSLLAKKIELKLGNLETPIPTPTPNPSGTPTPAPGGEDISLFGTIGTIDLLGSTLTIDNVTFLVDANTRIQDRTDLPLTFEDLRIDMRVLVEGDSLGNGTFRAREIKVLEENVVPGGGTSQRLTGITSSIVAGESMIVGQTEVDLTGNPTVRNFDGLPVSIAQIGEGDFVKVEGLPQTSGTLLASAIEVRASLLSAVNNEQTRLFASNTEVQVTAATEITDPTSGTIAFEDLTVGDLIEIQGSFNGAMLNAREIRRVSPLRFSGVIAGFAPVIPTIKGGAGAVRSANNVNTFGFVELPERTFPNVPNAIFELTARIRTDVATRSEVPVARVRTNMNTFTKGAEFVVTSEGDGRFAPTLEGKEYRSYFVPALGATDGNLADWYASMDLLNVNPNDAPQAELILESISAKPIDFSRLTVAETLYQESFSTAGHGWTNGGAPGTYSLPAFGQDGVKKALTVTPGDANTFGFWEFNTGIPVQPNTLYRGRFLVSADASNPTAVPTVRGRLNLTSFQLASVTVLESVGDAAESPAATPRLYDVYLYIPGVPVSGESILAAFDVLNNQGDNDTGRPVYLEHFTLERLTIAP